MSDLSQLDTFGFPEEGPWFAVSNVNAQNTFKNISFDLVL